MSIWGDGYRRGYYDALNKIKRMSGKKFDDLQAIVDFVWLEENLSKDLEAGPSMYAVANHCCGGVDAHNVNCRG